MAELSEVQCRNLLIEILSNGKGSLDYAKNVLQDQEHRASTDDDPPAEPERPTASPAWCMCGVCVAMPTEVENKCCKRRTCVTSYHQFAILCIDRTVLETAIKSRCDIRAEDFVFNTNEFRKAAYRQYIIWKFGKLGKGNRRVCPSCVVKLIRIAFPSNDGQYMGFKPF